MRRKRGSAGAMRGPAGIGSIPMIYDSTMMAVDFIDRLSGHDPDISKAVASCATLAVYSMLSEVDDPFLLMDEIMIDHVNNLGDLGEMLDDGTWTVSGSRCPHESECGDSDCSTCVFAQLRHIDVGMIGKSMQSSMTAGNPDPTG